MKIAYCILLVVFASCTYFQPRQQRAEGLAKKYLDSALNADKYEIIKTSKIDTLRGGPDDEQKYQLITKKIDSTYKIGDLLNKAIAGSKNYRDIAIFQDLSQKNFNRRNNLLHESLGYLLKYNGKPEGWIIEETFKFKNSADSSLYTATFKIDDKVSSVLSQQTTKIAL